MPPEPTRIFLRHAGDVADHDFRRGAGDQRRVVMLGQPVARVAELVGELREVERVAQRVRAGRAGRHRRNIQHGQAIRFLRSHAVPFSAAIHTQAIVSHRRSGTTTAA